MNKTYYLNTPVVREFINYFSGLIDGKSINHQYVIRDTKLPDGYKEDHCEKDGSLKIDNLEDAFKKYWWKSKDYYQNKAKLDQLEKDIFILLIGVSGIGPKTAIVLLSSVTPNEFKRRLIAGEVSMLTALPGIGPKTARRIIVELRDKFVKLSDDDLPKEDDDIVPKFRDAYAALLALGFQMQDIRRAIGKIKNGKKEMGTEEIVKTVLAQLQ